MREHIDFCINSLPEQTLIKLIRSFRKLDQTLSFPSIIVFLNLSVDEHIDHLLRFFYFISINTPYIGADYMRVHNPKLPSHM